jgi:hypothetical protein
VDPEAPAEELEEDEELEEEEEELAEELEEEDDISTSLLPTKEETGRMSSPCCICR